MNIFYEFESFRADEEKRLLWKDGELVSVKPKTFDTLLVLLKHKNEIISKDDLITEIWNGSAVSDDSLTQQISQLRKLLGDSADEHKFIVTVPGVGYKFVADVQTDNGHHLDKSFESEEENDLTEYEQRSKESNKNDAFQQTSWLAHKKIWAVGFLIFLILGLTAAYVWQNGKTKKTTALGIEKIAVLPFRTISQDDATNVIKQGMTDTLVSRLSKIKKITVLPSTLTASFEKSNQTPAEFGRKIGADSVLDGQIQKNGDELRITVQLVRSDDGKVLWSDEFRDNFTDIFELQSTIAYKITQALSLELSDEENLAIMKRHTTSAEAYRLYLDAFYIWGKRRNGEARAVAESNYRKAIELDPKFVLAYVGLANMEIDAPSQEAYRRMKTLAKQALEIDDTVGEAHEIYGFAIWRGDWNWIEPEEHYKKAIELSPTSLGSYGSLAMLYTGQGEFAEAEQVVDSYPIESTFTQVYRIMISYYQRDYDATIAKSRNMLEKTPNDVNALSYLTLAYSEKGDFENALQTAKQYNAFDTVAGVGGLVYIGYAYAKSGEDEKAHKILQEILKQKTPDSAQIHGGLAMLYGELGETDKAFEHLEKSIENREWWAFTLKVAPYYDSLRDDPRFDEMLRRVNLAE